MGAAETVREGSGVAGTRVDVARGGTGVGAGVAVGIQPGVQALTSSRQQRSKVTPSSLGGDDCLGSRAAPVFLKTIVVSHRVTC
ncbi:MAG: hypothetical protein JSW37_03580 [Anaerolineales bacterium]|nr:MAG: hypothetical protein JSW37_03580 [Anaerolineales bacterium]